MNLEDAVVAHYELGDLLARILGSLEASGVDLSNLVADDLAPVDEFHVGGRPATQYLVESLGLSAADHVLDVGCGIGGTARYLAAQVGCRVTGIDLTPEFIAAALDLTKRVGLDAGLRFEVGSALDMPFADGSFDAAVTLHVAMNISDRATLYEEVARVVQPGGVFGVYDVMSTGEGTLEFPLPWAEAAETSHLESAQATVDFLTKAGFEVEAVEERRDFALQFFEKARVAFAGATPSVGVHVNMGSTAKEKLANMARAVEQGLITPVQIRALRV